MRDQVGLARFTAISVLVTAGVYLGLYGFAAGSRTFVVLGIAAFVIAVTGLALRTFWWSRLHRQRAWIRGTAEVLTVSPPPPTGVVGRCELTVILAAPGLATSEVAVRDRRAPVRSWPEPGDALPVHVDVDDLRRVRVRWDEFVKQPEELVDPLLPRFDDPPPPWPDYPGPDGPAFTDEELNALSATESEYLPPRRVLPLEDEPSLLVARYLFPTERYRGEWRRHWVWIFNRYVLALGLAVAGEILVRRYVADDYRTAARAGVAVLGGLLSLRALIAHWFSRFVLTGTRVLLVEGVLRRRVSTVPLPHATELRYVQSLPGRLFNYADFVFERARFFSPIRRVSALPNPNELFLRVAEEVYDPGAVEARLRSYGEESY
ncbi:hypothetical protein BJ973_003829 [Actinoplanes tereljensis]|uniref:YdbS-like PH domain-containing protein n=1 Tax=Paractinoplanes tereljensis TaxID=571912 RepID=A0A919TZ55_9ACTN|nr:PH domain-containing protein [Actinoplanes tereljensis]GIF25552.1 hypothetical protein Ate02nite_82820 [Actinoplanes tereljensis]